MHHQGIRFVVFVFLLVWVPGSQESLQAQSFSWGAKGGFSLLRAVDLSFGGTDETRRYVIGPTLEMKLPGPFALEVSALYRRVGYSSVSFGFSSRAIGRVRGDSWEFPFLARWYISERSPIRPYVSGGYVLRHVSGLENRVHVVGVDFPTGEPFETEFDGDTRSLLSGDPTHGGTVGGGIRLQHGFLGVAPEIRYTRWGGRPLFDESGSHGFFVTSSQNQLDLLVSITF